MTNAELLTTLRDAAKAANHIWPEYAAAEAAYDSNWDAAGLIAAANNPFAIEQVFKDMGKRRVFVAKKQVITRGGMIDRQIEYVWYGSIQEAFVHRVEMLRNFNMYRDARYADTGEEYVMQVSALWRETVNPLNTPMYSSFLGKTFRCMGGRWSPDPQRAVGVLKLYEDNRGVFA